MRFIFLIDDNTWLAAAMLLSLKSAEERGEIPCLPGRNLKIPDLKRLSFWNPIGISRIEKQEQYEKFWESRESWEDDEVACGKF